jgi:hypothetical protein
MSALEASSEATRERACHERRMLEDSVCWVLSQRGTLPATRLALLACAHRFGPFNGRSFSEQTKRHRAARKAIQRLVAEGDLVCVKATRVACWYALADPKPPSIEAETRKCLENRHLGAV